MAKKYPSQTIIPFQPESDRERFGDWLSGFVDGEGCFRLSFAIPAGGRHKSKAPKVEFQLSLRADDLQILKKIQSYWGCGTVYCYSKPGENPVARFHLTRVDYLHDILVPHFDSHPLHSKKGRDFRIFKAGVQLMYSVRYVAHHGSYNNRGRVKWSDEKLALFSVLVDELHRTREYNSDNLDIPLVDTTEHLPLFDNLSSPPQSGAPSCLRG